MNQPSARWRWFAGAVLGVLVWRARADDRAPTARPAPPGPPPPAQATPDAPTKGDAAEPVPISTDHTVTIGGQAVNYRATAGYYYLSDDPPRPWALDGGTGGLDAVPVGADAKHPKDDEPKAKIFYVAYTKLGGGDVAKRPLTFAFNGGPGSASLWLHLGALGPRRVRLTERGESPPPPYGVEDNAESWIDQTDLVFIDPMSTGFSRPAAGAAAHDFYGYQQDLASLANFIRLYTTRTARWASPKLIAGESYGTTRAAGLSEYLQQRYGLYLNGIVLVSSALNFQAASFARGNDVAYPNFLPSFAAVAWYHRRLAPDLQAKPLAAVLQEAENFANGDYWRALRRGEDLAAEEKTRIATELARLTGISAERIAQLNLRLPDGLFFTELLKTENRAVGRYDGRFAGVRDHPGTEEGEYDPSYEGARPAFTGAVNDYLRRELKFESDFPYEVLTPLQPWPLEQNRYLDVAETLRRAMNRNPYLKVWICCGYYDLATPYFAAKTTVAGLLLDPAVRGNLTMTYYESGHMLYVNRPSLVQFKQDFSNFLQQAVGDNRPALPAAAP